MRTGWAALAGALALSGCGKPKQLYVDHAWVRLPAVRAQPGAAYFTIHGGKTDATLIAVNTDVAIRSELHESMAGGGGMETMKPLASVAIPARTAVTFQPGGRHVMLWNINPGIKPGRRITLTLTFADGTRILQDAPVVDAGGAEPE